MIGAQSGVYGHPGPSWVLDPQKAEDEEAQALDPIKLPPGFKTRRELWTENSSTG